jgi:hypothetical protein
MIQRISILIYCLIFLSSCATYYQSPELHKGEGIKVKYEDQIKEWQKRMKEDGWTNELVDEIASTIQSFVQYNSDDRPDYKWKDDYWYTPGEMIEAEFKGDCEDIGILLYGTLKKLRYPHVVRLVILETIQWDEHLMVKVQMPNGNNKFYETVDVLGIQVDQLFYRPMIEFDEDNIYIYSWYKNQLEGDNE